MFRVHMLPAAYGDCLWIDYGPPANPKVILVDGGTGGTWAALKKKLKERAKLLGRPVAIELFVITHVDSDHIGGAVSFLSRLDEVEVDIRELWFNGWWHLNRKKPPPPQDVLGSKQGEALSALIQAAGIPWNTRFDRGAVVVPDEGPLPAFDFAGMQVVLLSPTWAKLEALIPAWRKELESAGLVPGKPPPRERRSGDVLGTRSVKTLASAQFQADTAPANGSSIAFLLRHAGRSGLFGADAHAEVLLENLARPPLRSRAAFDAFKLAHHGSMANTSAELVKAAPAHKYLISTNGSIFQHPDEEAIARILFHGAKAAPRTLHFNYRTDQNKRWASPATQREFRYEAHYGDAKQGLVIDL